MEINSNEFNHDKTKKIFEYKDSWLKLFDYKVFYLPYFNHQTQQSKEGLAFIPHLILHQIVWVHQLTFLIIKY